MTYQDVILGDNPNLYFRLGERAGSTTITDLVRGYSGTIPDTSIFTLGVAGALTQDTNTALEVNKNAALYSINCGNINITTNGGSGSNQAAIDFEFWIKIPSLNSAGLVLFQATDAVANMNFWIILTNGQYTGMQLWGSSASMGQQNAHNYSSAPTSGGLNAYLCDGNWHYIYGFIAVNGAAFNTGLWVDGTSVYSGGGSGVGSVPSGYNPLFSIASNNGYDIYYLDEFAIYPSSSTFTSAGLTQSQINNHYSARNDFGGGYEVITLSVLEASTGIITPGMETFSPPTVLESKLANQSIEQFPPSLTTVGSFETFESPVVAETLRLDLLNYLLARGYCPPAPPPVIAVQGVSPISEGPNTVKYYNSGYYYRVPVDTSQTGSEPVPKYSNLFPQPYAAFVYPVSDVHYGKILIKTLTPLSGTVPSDVVAILASDAANDLQSDVGTIFAL